MSHTQDELVELAHQFLYPNYRQPPLVLQRGRGVEVWDVEGKRYLDFLAGVAVNALGHAHPRLVEAISAQTRQLTHVSNYFFNEPNILLAQRLCQLTNMARALFCNSGTEAIEALLKLARRHYYGLGQKERHHIIAFERSFHGRTMGALAATGQAGYREGFGPLGPVTHVPYGDLDAVKGALGPHVAGILVEPVQGEGGVVPAPPGFLAGLRELCDAHGCLLLADEIQTGVGRTGTFLAFESSGVRADALALAKGLGGGFPIGAMLCSAALESALPPGSHGSTFGGNPLASATALTVLQVIEEDDLMASVRSAGEYLDRQLTALCRKHPRKTVTTRGVGLLRALELAPELDIRAVLNAVRSEGLMLSVAGGTALRFSPPLIVTPAHIDEAVAIVDHALGTQP